MISIFSKWLQFQTVHFHIKISTFSRVKFSNSCGTQPNQTKPNPSLKPEPSKTEPDNTPFNQTTQTQSPTPTITTTTTNSIIIIIISNQNKSKQKQRKIEQSCTGTHRALTLTTMATRCTGTLAMSKKVVPLTGTSVTLLSALSFVTMSPPPLEFSWLAVAMLVISLPFLLVHFCYFYPSL
jgi:hypothetical protein